MNQCFRYLEQFVHTAFTPPSMRLSCSGFTFTYVYSSILVAFETSKEVCKTRTERHSSI